MMFPYSEMMGGLPFGGLWWFAPLLGILMVWDAVWKGIGMWRASKNDQLAWFIAMLVINSVGILPIIYILFFQKGRGKIIIIPEKPEKKAKKKK